ncbi:MAG: hypothetical protein AB1650_08460 [Candidatus Omnitrophota bacterium]
MIAFYIITLLVLAALAFVFLLIWKEQNADEDQAKREEEKTTAAGLLDRLGLKEQEESKSSITPASFLAKFFHFKKEPPAMVSVEKTNTTPTPLPKSGTAAMRLDNSSNDALVEQSIRNDELQKETLELREKTEKLEQLLSEKNEEIKKVTSEIAQEQRHRKEFNKVKDLLEKELKETKDEFKRVQSELNAIKSEGQTYLNRISQLESKIKTNEKSLEEKDAIIQEHVQTIHTLENSQVIKTPAEVQLDTAAAESVTNPEQTEKPAEFTSEAKTEDATVEQNLPEEKIPSGDDNQEKTSFDNPVNEEEQKTVHEIQESISIDPVPESKRDNLVDADNKNFPFSPSLDLNPVSNLEHNYETDAAPQIANEETGTPPKEIEQIITEKDASKPVHAHLGPDIFKDIEEQFRKIEEEMNFTQDKENINIEENQQNQSDKDPAEKEIQTENEEEEKKEEEKEEEEENKEKNP